MQHIIHQAGRQVNFTGHMCSDNTDYEPDPNPRKVIIITIKLLLLVTHTGQGTNQMIFLGYHIFHLTMN